MGDIQAEVESIENVAHGMTGGAIGTAKKLQEVLASLNDFAASSDWSQVPSCQAFGQSYNSAIIAYKAVADDMLADAQAMQKVLLDNAAAYRKSDDNSQSDFDARMAQLGSQDFMTHQDKADQTYQQHRGDLHSDHAEAAPEQPADAAANASTPATPAPSTTGRGSVRME